MKHIISVVALLLSFYLGLYNNNLAIYDTEHSKPVMVLPYRADLYPQEDQQRLRAGIHFESNDELAGLLEDFIS